ncbi:hypothetical protein DFH94DRAFT_634849 [Russula ochroleuca]|jgi:hypothetical protein|uniref:Uncharacterized protein n=1 Tax=Russula ochroleuca TaxID=152965 RepID=A0A9P5MSA5_9AGAM|nr:hypothetical protein DFH94DRAFT_634849 [Russula ochroleuca]
MTASYALDADGPSPNTVPLGEGTPTKEELLVYYPTKFTWTQLKTFVNSGDLGLLKRDKKLQERYLRWIESIKAEYGSNANYLIRYRLRWGQADTLSKLPSRLSPPVVPLENGDIGSGKIPVLASGLPPIPPDTKPYFTADIPLQLVSIITNDWPYLVPTFIEHYLIWTVLPILPHDLPSIIRTRLLQDGLWGFTGYTPDSPPPSPSLLPTCLPALSDWCVTEASLIRTPRGTEEEETAVREAGLEVHKFVIATWKEREWETAWFVNPPRLQSVSALEHIHVFARYKSAEEANAWDHKTT